MVYAKNKGMKDWGIFIRVVETGSFSRAAQELGSSISTISKTISRLEAVVGTMLMRRDARNFELTEAGQQAYRRGKEIIDCLDILLDDLRNPSGDVRGRIRFSAPSLICNTLANQWAYEFTELYPEVQLTIDIRERFDLNKESVGFDDILLHGGRIRSDELVHRPVAPIPLVNCAAPSYLAQHEPITNPEDLSQHWVLCLHKHTLAGSITLYHGKERQVVSHPENARIYFNNQMSLLSLVLQGKGISINTPLWLVADKIAKGELALVLPNWVISPLPAYLVWRHRSLQYYSPLFNVFRAFVQEKWNVSQSHSVLSEATTKT